MKNYRVLTIGYTYMHDKKVPYIRLQGQWLAEYGFLIGDKVEIQCKQKLLNILKS